MSEGKTKPKGGNVAFEITRRNQLKRKHRRGHHDKRTVYQVLDLIVLEAYRRHYGELAREDV